LLSDFVQADLLSRAQNMNHCVLWTLSVATSALAEEAVTEWLARTFGAQPTSYTDVDSGRTTVTVFLNKRPDWSTARRLALKNSLKKLKRFGLDRRLLRISLTKLPRQNWAESWKRHFRPIEIRSRLLIKPHWSRRRPARNQATVILNPGLSFGTGQHPTTKFCLDQIVAWRRPTVTQSFLDLGSGSGILAIAAAKLGYSPVNALDSDPEAIRFAQANIRLNRLSRQVRVSQMDVSRLPRRPPQRYSLVCANLIVNLLVKEKERIVAHLEKGGLLVLAGILATEFTKVRREYAKRGLRLVTHRTEGEWRSGSFCW
jgi:ribosomal protein L11 methyltransferase